jgi:predicted phage terminase large subunit-like protein
MKATAAELEALAATAASQRLLAYAIGLNREYKTPPHIELLADALEAVERGEIKRLMVFMPPRHGKSNLASEIFPAWYLGRKPHHQVMFTTYGQDLADGFGRKVRNAVADPRHTRAFPGSLLAEDSQSAKRFNTGAGGVYYAVGAGGAVTGRGADLLILDDPLKNREEADSRLIRDKLWDWYASTAYTRLMPGGAVVLIQTRWHEDDLAGRLLKGEENWKVINLPAIAEENDLLGRSPGRALWPEQYDIQALENIRGTIGQREFAALYQQRPAPLEGALFKRDWIRTGRSPGAGVRIAMGVDLALSTKESADYTAIAVMARDEFGKLYVLDVVRERVDFPNALRLIRNMADKWNPRAIAIEQVAYQAVVVQELLRQTTLPIRGVLPDKDKVTRAQPLALRYEQGLVQHAHDLPGWFTDELFAFPNGQHDDAVDALVYAYQQVMKLSVGGASLPDPREVAWTTFDPSMGT